MARRKNYFIKQASIMCPNLRCRKQSVYTLYEPARWYAMRCSFCETEFVSKVVTIRSKRSRSKKHRQRSNNISYTVASWRDYSIRIYYPTGEEDLIEFTQTGGFLVDGVDDFDLRSGDIAAFTYLNNYLRVVENLTTSRYITFKKRGSSNVGLYIVIGLIILLFLCAYINMTLNSAG